MARARNIKPGFFESEQVGSVSISARLLFISLWQLADREGRLLDRPMQIKAFAFRYDAISADSVDGWIAELDAAGLIVRYQADGQKLIEIPNFVRHQRPHQREEQSVLPARFEQKPDLGRAEHNLGTAEGPYMGGQPALNPECGILNPECGILNPECGKRNEEGGGLNAGLTPAPPPPQTRQLAIVASGPDPDELFQTAAKFACEHLPAGGDVGLTAAAMRSEFQKSASFEGNPAGFCMAYTASVRKWRAAYDANPDLRTKQAQWWTRDGTYAQAPPAPRAPRQFGPVDLKAGLEVEDAM